MTALVFSAVVSCGCSYNVYYVNIALGCFFLAQGLPVAVVGGSQLFCSVRCRKLFATTMERSVMRIAMCLQKPDAKNVTEKNNRREGSGTACKFVRAMAFASCVGCG